MPNPNNCLLYRDLADHIRIDDALAMWCGVDQPLLVALSRAFHWQQLLDDGVAETGSDIAKRKGLHHSTVNELLRLTLPEPEIVKAIYAGQQPRCMSLLWFQRTPLPADWAAQQAVVARFDA